MISYKAAETLILPINRGLETLWLLAAFFTPLVFFNHGYVISEASIGYAEVPKIALLRILAGLTAVLWLIEWGISGRFVGPRPRFRPQSWVSGLFTWVRGQPTRWLFLAAWLFLATTLLSTILSGSRNVSLWGEVPGQDGYPAYTVVSYFLIFAVIATHLKTKAQLWRLIGAIVAMGTLVSGYAICQHYGHDFLDLIEQTGGGASEVSVFMGNSLFAGATLMGVVPVTLMAAVFSVERVSHTPKLSWNKLRPLLPSLALASLWSAVLAVQLLGITFTFARGPWVGTMSALVMFLGLATIFIGWRLAARVSAIVGLTVAFGAAMLHGFGSTPILGLGPWFSGIIVLLGVFAFALTYVQWGVLGRIALVVGAVITVVVVVLLAMSWFRSDAPGPQSETSSAVSSDHSELSVVLDQVSSIKEDVLTGFASGRGTHWKVSLRLFRDHPWPAFDTLSLRWLRHLVGYGPELFRYTYLLESPPVGADFLPQEPDHAHNFFLHQAVEQGILGLFSSLGIFGAVFTVGTYLLFRHRHTYPQLHKLILIGLIATLAGRFLEMTVGVARVSDLTLLWVLFALFACLPRVMSESESLLKTASSQSRISHSGAATSSRVQFDWWFMGRLGVVAWLIGGIFVFTWVKSVNNVRAAVSAGDAMESIREGDLQGGLDNLSRAIELAPDVSAYYNYKGLVYSSYQAGTAGFRQTIPRADVPRERECGARVDQGYLECLAFTKYLTNLMGSAKRPFYYRSHLALATSAYTLGAAGATMTLPGPTPDGDTTIVFADEAIRLYKETLSLVPSSPRIRIELADAYIVAGQPEVAHTLLEDALAITGDDDGYSALAYLVESKAYYALAEYDRAAESLEQYLLLDPTGTVRGRYANILLDFLHTLDSPRLAAPILEKLGLSYATGGLHEQAAKFYEESAELYSELGDLEKLLQVLHRYSELRPTGKDGSGYVSYLLGILPDLGQSRTAVEAFQLLGDYNMATRNFDGAAEAFERSAILSLELGEFDLAMIGYDWLRRAYLEVGIFDNLAHALNHPPKEIGDQEASLTHLVGTVEGALRQTRDSSEEWKMHGILADILFALGFEERAQYHLLHRGPGLVWPAPGQH